MTMLTKWGATLDRSCPLPEYPRPQLRRESFYNLNGVWDYAVTPSGEEPEVWDGEIVVPFSPEAPLSGAARGPAKDEYLHYRRGFTLPEGFQKSRVLLHFGAVDQIAEVFVNGVSAAKHSGGYWPFSADITSLLREGENILRVTVRDNADDPTFAYGKQRYKRGGMWYTAQSGIWQTVWLESVPEVYVKSLRITPEFDEARVRIELETALESGAAITCDVRAADGRSVMEFGSRRAQGFDGAIYGARAAYIGGCVGTACTISDRRFGVPALGTMAHSWVQLFDSEYEAFKAYAEEYPHNCTLLVDTYNVLKSGVPNAIRAFNEVLRPKGITHCGIRFDSGDIAYLTKKARKMLDDAGWPDCKITVSNALDERLIAGLLRQGAQIDSFGVGERLITARSEPVFGGVYKLAAIEDENGTIIPKIKISENVGKITNPHFKKVYRFYSKDSGMAEADYICLHDEVVDDTQPLEICDPDATGKKKVLTDFTARELLVPIFRGGRLVYQKPALDDIRAYCAQQLTTLWPEVLRFDYPHNYYVDLSEKLLKIKLELLNAGGKSQG